MTVNVSKPAINVREKLAELDKPTGIAGEAMLRAETPQEQFSLIGAGRRNLIINGDFRISQRGSYTSATNAANGDYYLDRFFVRNSKTSSDMTIQDITNDLPDNLYGIHAKKCVSVNGHTSTEHMGFRQLVEDYEMLKGKTVTYSAWVKANTPVELWIYDLGTNEVTEGTAHSGNGQWEKLSVTRTIGTGSLTGLSTYITTYGYTTPTNGYHISTQHQLEVGKVATPFEHRSYGEELALCQRYLYRLSGDTGDDRTIGVGFASATNDADIYVQYPVELRDIPSTTVGTDIDEASFKISTASAGTNSSLNSIIDPTRQSVRLRFRADSGTPFTVGEGCMGRLDNSASAYIEFDAEL